MNRDLFLSSIAAPLLAAVSVPAHAGAPEADGMQDPAEAHEEAERIARLIEVWGFVKYHHSDAREGRLAMDREFFELYPAIAGAGSMAEAETVLVRWLARIGTGEPCAPCARDRMPEPGKIALDAPTGAWMASLPEPLATPINAINTNRSAASANFQIETARGVGNAKFLNEPDYRSTTRDDAALRMLAAARMWNTLRYWFPYRDVMDAPAADILVPAIAEVFAARTVQEHQRALVKLAVRADDGHARILAYRDAVAPAGDCIIPYTWRHVEGQLVVDGVEAHPANLLRAGDVVRAIDGESMSALEERYASFVPASNEASRMNGLSYRLQSGACGARTLTLDRDGATIEVTVEWMPPKEAGIDLSHGRDRAGPVIQELEGDVVYVRFPMLKRGDVAELVARANAGSGLVLDMRGYVTDYLIYELGSRLRSEPFDFALFTQPSPATPGLFTWSDPVTIEPAADGVRITVPVVALIDETAGSSPEYHAMAWRAGGVRLVGSPTAGADGNVSSIALPRDGAEMRFSGVGVHYPDRSPTQRIGIVPDIEVTPTRQGIAAGRDEVLERALVELRSMRDEQSAP